MLHLSSCPNSIIAYIVCGFVHVIFCDYRAAALFGTWAEEMRKTTAVDETRGSISTRSSQGSASLFSVTPSCTSNQHHCTNHLWFCAHVHPNINFWDYRPRPPKRARAKVRKTTCRSRGVREYFYTFKPKQCMPVVYHTSPDAEAASLHETLVVLCPRNTQTSVPATIDQHRQRGRGTRQEQEHAETNRVGVFLRVEGIHSKSCLLFATPNLVFNQYYCANSRFYAHATHKNRFCHHRAKPLCGAWAKIMKTACRGRGVYEYFHTFNAKQCVSVVCYT